MSEHREVFDIREARRIIAALRSQVAELQAKLDEQGKPEPVVWMASNHLEGFVHQACGTDSMLARCSYRQIHTDYRPLYRLPPNTEAIRAEEREACAALAMEMFHSAAQGDEIADAIRARK